MIRPMFGGGPKPRRFNLPLRYYDPTKDEQEEIRKRIAFKRLSHRRPPQVTRIIFFALLLSLIIYIISR